MVAAAVSCIALSGARRAAYGAGGQPITLALKSLMLALRAIGGLAEAMEINDLDDRLLRLLWPCLVDTDVPSGLRLQRSAKQGGGLSPLPVPTVQVRR